MPSSCCSLVCMSYMTIHLKNLIFTKIVNTKIRPCFLENSCEDPLNNNQQNSKALNYFDNTLIMGDNSETASSQISSIPISRSNSIFNFRRQSSKLTLPEISNFMQDYKGAPHTDRPDRKSALLTPGGSLPIMVKTDPNRKITLSMFAASEEKTNPEVLRKMKLQQSLIQKYDSFEKVKNMIDQREKSLDVINKKHTKGSMVIADLWDHNYYQSILKKSGIGKMMDKMRSAKWQPSEVNEYLLQKEYEKKVGKQHNVLLEPVPEVEPSVNISRSFSRLSTFKSPKLQGKESKFQFNNELKRGRGSINEKYSIEEQEFKHSRTKTLGLDDNLTTLTQSSSSFSPPKSSRLQPIQYESLLEQEVQGIKNRYLNKMEDEEQIPGVVGLTQKELSRRKRKINRPEDDYISSQMSLETSQDRTMSINHTLEIGQPIIQQKKEWAQNEKFIAKAQEIHRQCVKVANPKDLQLYFIAIENIMNDAKKNKEKKLNSHYQQFKKEQMMIQFQGVMKNKDYKSSGAEDLQTHAWEQLDKLEHKYKMLAHQNSKAAPKKVITLRSSILRIPTGSPRSPFDPAQILSPKGDLLTTSSPRPILKGSKFFELGQTSSEKREKHQDTHKQKKDNQ